jgi:hypothetical protein
MSNSGGYIPESIDHFALKIITRLHLDQASTMPFVSTIIREAVYEERKTVHMREAVSCFGCRTLILRYQGLNDQYCTRCPVCREPMLTQEELYRKKFHLLEEQVQPKGPSEA